MTGIVWNHVGRFTLRAGQFRAPWAVAYEDVSGGAYLKLRCSGSWTAVTGLPVCGPDGLAGQPVPDERLLLGDCPIGAVVGRIGGGSANVKNFGADIAAGKPFAVGQYAVLKLPEKTAGPLFLGINVLSRPINVQALLVNIYSGNLP